MSEQTSWICGSCGTANTSNFCASCGSPKPAATQTVPVAQPAEPVAAPVQTPAQAPAQQPVQTAVPGAVPTQPGAVPTQQVPGAVPTPVPGAVPGGQNFNTQTTNPRGTYGERSLKLADWKTNVGMSILGVVAILAINGIVNAVLPEIFTYVIAVILCAVGIAYAAAVYPSYFTDEPKVDSAGTISFLNLLLGGIIFGCIWNANLTKGMKGSSWIVFIVLQALLLVALIWSLVFLGL